MNRALLFYKSIVKRIVQVLILDFVNLDHNNLSIFRTPLMTMRLDPSGKLTEKVELKMKTWLHIVARTKTIPKDFVCGEDCEQTSIYGRFFDGHPLNHVNSEDIDLEDEEKD